MLGGFGRLVGAQWVPEGSRPLAYRAGAALGREASVCGDALFILFAPFVRGVNMGSGDVSRNALW